jgi:hypothetical protein
VLQFTGRQVGLLQRVDGWTAAQDNCGRRMERATLDRILRGKDQQLPPFTDTSLGVGTKPSVLALRPATESDVEFLTALRRETMWEHFENSGRSIDETNQLNRVLHRFDCARIITMSGEDIGLLKVARDVDPWELIQIQLLPKYQRQGLGKSLLDALLIEWA